MEPSKYPLSESDLFLKRLESVWGFFRHPEDSLQSPEARHDLPGAESHRLRVQSCTTCFIPATVWTGSRRTPTRSAVPKNERPVQRLGGRGRGCNKFVPVLGGNGTKIAPTGNIFDQSPGQMR